MQGQEKNLFTAQAGGTRGSSLENSVRIDSRKPPKPQQKQQQQQPQLCKKLKKRKINCLNIAGIENFPDIQLYLPRAWSLPELTAKIR